MVQKVMDDRFNAKTNSLDLSDFSKDEEFVRRDMLICLTKASVMSAVINWIGLKYPRITAISLSNNRICHLENLLPLANIIKNLKTLDLSHNHISSLDELGKLRKLAVEELAVEGNPVCEKFSQVSEYINFISKIFPNCTELDGIEVKQKGGYYGSEKIRTLVEEFLLAYYKIYDGSDGQQTRKQLIDAYDVDSSTLTLTIQCLWDPAKYILYPDSTSYRLYLRNSHNVLQQEFFAGNRSERVFHGAMDIAVTLSKLPATYHLLETFVVDVFLFSETLLGFTVHGLFRDGVCVTNPTKANDMTENFFTRTFLVEPRGEGQVAVISDQLFISSMSNNRLKRHRSLLASAS
ncbi:unnamed protein product [Caenorhabditis sp. 36 PRJEB53466]|nr:unnamed protein product [Caenorhabditis sp. 36 PRJEB53466]